jgi:hypothetical protein
VVLGIRFVVVEMSKDHRNELFFAITDGGLDAKSCVLNTEASEYFFLITHTATRSWIGRLLVSPSSDAKTWGGYYQIGTDTPVTWTVMDRWPGVVGQVQRWASEVHEWEETPDLWAQLASAPGLHGSLEQPADNTLFTPAQQTDLAAQLDEVMARLSVNAGQLGLTAGDVEAIRQDVGELKEASKRVGPKDWRVMVYGYAVGWLAHGVDPSAIGTVVGMIFHAVGHILGMPSPPPPIPA